MRYRLLRRALLALLSASIATLAASASAQDAPAGQLAHWSFESIDAPGATATRHGREATPHGGCQVHPSGVRGKCLVLDGMGAYVSIPDGEWLRFSDATFSISVWINPYSLRRGQQMIVGKNVYSANKREWGLMLDQDRRLRFYCRAKGWKKIASKSSPEPGRWTHVAVTLDHGRGKLYVNGACESEATLPRSIPDTDAPLTIGAIRDGKRTRQMFLGAIDELRIFARTLDSQEIEKMANQKPTPHEVPESARPVALWKGDFMPPSSEIPDLHGVEFVTIQPHEPANYRWLHGVSLAWHKGRLYASYGRNKGRENSPGEAAHGRMSTDGGKTWGPVFTIAESHGEGEAVSHGVYLSRGEELWAFHGAFTGVRENVHARAYLLDEATGAWIDKGTVVAGGFWPLQSPLRMDDGNWIMAGIRCQGGYNDPANHAAVAISHGDDLTAWDLVVIPNEAPGNMWAESDVIVDGPRVTCIARYQQNRVALAAESEDYGRTWTPTRPTDVPMTESKPCAGMLTDGRRYLICTTTGDNTGRRSPLTIALSRPGERLFSSVFVIRRDTLPGHPEMSGKPQARLSYPCAIEHEGALYVGYSNECGRGGNLNAAEMAIIPISSLATR